MTVLGKPWFLQEVLWDLFLGLCGVPEKKMGAKVPSTSLEQWPNILASPRVKSIQSRGRTVVPREPPQDCHAYGQQGSLLPSARRPGRRDHGAQEAGSSEYLGKFSFPTD